MTVLELDSARRFYVEVLGATTGRVSSDWLDVILWAQQITLQLRPAETHPLSEQGKRHFGAVLPWQEWQAEVKRLRSLGIVFLDEPVVSFEGTAQEQPKFYLNDPSYNVLSRSGGHINAGRFAITRPDDSLSNKVPGLTRRAMRTMMRCRAAQSWS